MYESLASFAQTGGLILFVLGFFLMLAYALAPSNRNKFREAGKIPLKDEDVDDGR